MGKKLNPNFSENAAGHMPRDVCRPVTRAARQNSFVEVLCSFVEDCNVCTVHVASAGSETGERAVKNKLFFSFAFFTVLKLD